MLLEHMHKKFEINQTKIKGGCQLGRKVVAHNSKSDLPLVSSKISPGPVYVGVAKVLEDGYVLFCHLSEILKTTDINKEFPSSIL